MKPTKPIQDPNEYMVDLAYRLGFWHGFTRAFGILETTAIEDLLDYLEFSKSSIPGRDWKAVASAIEESMKKFALSSGADKRNK